MRPIVCRPMLYREKIGPVPHHAPVGMVDKLLKLVPMAGSSHIRMYRDHDTWVVEYYCFCQRMSANVVVYSTTCWLPEDRAAMLSGL